MKSLTKELWMEVPERRAIVSIHENISARDRERRAGRAGAGQRDAHHGQRFHQRRRVGPAHDYKEWLEGLAPFDASPAATSTIAPARTTPTPT